MGEEGREEETEFKRENDDLAEEDKDAQKYTVDFCRKSGRDEDVDEDDFEVKSMDFLESRYLLVGGTSTVEGLGFEDETSGEQTLSSGGLDGGRVGVHYWWCREAVGVVKTIE